MEQLIYPVLRKADFSFPQETINKPEALKISKHVEEKLKTEIDKYITAVRNVVIDNGDSIVDCKMTENQETRIIEEGDFAYIIDNPILEAKWEEFIFRIRITIAVCYKQMSTKSWTRVSLKNGISKNDKDFNKLNNFYQNIASACCNVSHNLVSDVITNNQKKSPKSVGDFSIMTFGVQDQLLGKYLELFDDADLKLKELFQKEEAKKLILGYYDSFFNKTSNELSLINNDNYWINTSSSLLDQNGYVVNNNVLYKIIVKDNNLFALGLGHDDSFDGSLASISSLKVAKFFAKDI